MEVRSLPLQQQKSSYYINDNVVGAFLFVLGEPFEHLLHLTILKSKHNNEHR